MSCVEKGVKPDAPLSRTCSHPDKDLANESGGGRITLDTLLFDFVATICLNYVFYVLRK